MKLASFHFRACQTLLCGRVSLVVSSYQLEKHLLGTILSRHLFEGCIFSNSVLQLLAFLKVTCNHFTELHCGRPVLFCLKTRAIVAVKACQKSRIFNCRTFPNFMIVVKSKNIPIDIKPVSIAQHFELDPLIELKVSVSPLRLFS